MSFQHHNEGMSEELRKVFEDEAEARRRFSEQAEGRAIRKWPEGRIGPEDDGELAFAIGPHPKEELIVLDFGKPVEFVAMHPSQAVEVAQALIKHARAISTEPLKVTIH